MFPLLQERVRGKPTPHVIPSAARNLPLRVAQGQAEARHFCGIEVLGMVSRTL